MHRDVPSSLLARGAATLAHILSVGACNGSGQPVEPASPSPTGSPVAVGQPLECEAEGYPCLLSDVPADRVARSVELGREAMGRIVDGAAVKETADWLRGLDGMAVVDADEATIRFRVDGARPTWLLSDSDPEASSARTDHGAGAASLHLEPLAQAIAAGRPLAAALVARPGEAAGPVATGSRETFASLWHRPGAGVAQARYAVAPVPFSVVGAASEIKAALVLAPFAHLGLTRTPRDIATLLEGTRGYEGAVTYIENGTAGSRRVNADTFAEFAGRSVVYVSSRGGWICRDRGNCFSVIAAEAVNDPGFHLGQQSPVDILIFKDRSEAIGVGDDFFRRAYPRGVRDALIVLDAPIMSHTGRPSFGASLAGGGSDLFFWSSTPSAPRDRDVDARAKAIHRFIGHLVETGRTDGAAYADAEISVGPMTLAWEVESLDGGLVRRIRDVVTLIDAATGSEVEDGDRLTIEGTPGDGEPDRVAFSVEVEGMSDDEASRTTVNVLVNDVESEPLLVSEGERVGELTWRVTSEVELPDVTPGEAASVLSVAQLPEGGISQQARSVTLSGGAVDDLGTRWTGEFERSWSDSGLVRTTTGVATFERREGTDPAATWIVFELVDGSMTWSAGVGQTEKGCTETATPVTVSGATGAIYFDLSQASDGVITYSGDASVATGPSVDVTVTCPGRTYEYSTEADGPFFLAPESEGYVLAGSSATGTYISGGQIPETSTWTLTKAE
jgi:hypothetical protein